MNMVRVLQIAVPVLKNVRTLASGHVSKYVKQRVTKHEVVSISIKS